MHPRWLGRAITLPGRHWCTPLETLTSSGNCVESTARHRPSSPSQQCALPVDRVCSTMTVSLPGACLSWAPTTPLSEPARLHLRRDLTSASPQSSSPPTFVSRLCGSQCSSSSSVVSFCFSPSFTGDDHSSSSTLASSPKGWCLVRGRRRSSSRRPPSLWLSLDRGFGMRASELRRTLPCPHRSAGLSQVMSLHPSSWFALLWRCSIKLQREPFEVES
mmetsp:Transcript_57705/g.125489  ORF Transcript_57705/g.125489 Transcript_57705/m.125489 type:complete len:218 (-) Transcript_57705:147-800(-)